mmetsp:Transcript_23667/g.39058  ORF Transcript_23667/g.39058 Transcript_23667/m.39058 type:complete len:191 (-) Transcript_23667:272-844(-)|eukprot:CAMPEP_0119307560 /NCGR_PEP_ID=MMETSP1333-20130426/8022_1 /TAXON_ID=418940 /ORGANISM="Scyphosphaera apsteinii, Strain RCC1455" /LENGTH=190 /DNA_ID=CAMNT_0007311133 /DNA_START=33 /DNA_END=605 /DNA_ORIENTATION=+
MSGDLPPSKVQRIDEAMPFPPLLVKRISEFATLPIRGTPYAAGYDLAAAHECIIPAHGKGLVKTDLAIHVPDGCYGRIAPRSGLAWKNFIDVGAGVIDADYRGNVGVLLFNHGEAELKVARGDRVAQLILERIATPEVIEVADLEDSARGAGGFGSTGVQGKAADADSKQVKPLADKEKPVGDKENLQSS